MPSSAAIIGKTRTTITIQYYTTLPSGANTRIQVYEYYYGRGWFYDSTFVAGNGVVGALAGLYPFTPYHIYITTGGSNCFFPIYTLGNTGNPPNVNLIGTTDTTATVSFSSGGGGLPADPEAYVVNLLTENGAGLSSQFAQSPFTITGLSPFTNYRVAVYGYNSNWPEYTEPKVIGIGYTAQLVKTLARTGSAPTITSVSQYSDKLEVYFTPSTGGIPGVTKYTANYYIYGTVFTGLPQIREITRSPFMITGLSSNTLYQIDLYPYNDNWSSIDGYGPAGVNRTLTLKSLDLTFKYIFENKSILSFFNGTDLLVDTTSNNVPTTYFEGLAYSSVALYMFGTRTPVGYQINGVDVGNYFQQDPIQKVYIISNAVGNSYWNQWRISPTTDKFDNTGVKWIWSTSESATNNLESPLLWFYYTFMYNGVRSIDTTLYCVADDYTKIYINGKFVTSQGGKFPYVQIKPGLNYIRAFARSTGGAAGFKLTIVDNNLPNDLLCATNGDWAWSYSTSSYHTVLNNLAFGSNDPESGSAPFVGIVY